MGWLLAGVSVLLAATHAANFLSGLYADSPGSSLVMTVAAAVVTSACAVCGAACFLCGLPRMKRFRAFAVVSALCLVLTTLSTAAFALGAIRLPWPFP